MSMEAKITWKKNADEIFGRENIVLQTQTRSGSHSYVWINFPPPTLKRMGLKLGFQ